MSRFSIACGVFVERPVSNGLEEAQFTEYNYLYRWVVSTACLDLANCSASREALGSKKLPLIVPVANKDLPIFGRNTKLVQP